MDKIKFGALFDYKKKSKIKAGDGLKKDEGIYPFYTSSNKLSKSINEFLFSGPSLIFGTGGLPSIHFCEEKFAVSTDCLVAQPIDNLRTYAPYVYYFFSQYNLRILDEGFKGAGLKHISRKYIDNLKIPLPPLETQKRIAQILDDAAALRDKTAQLLKEYDLLAQSIFLDMFGDPAFNPFSYPEVSLISLTKDKYDIKCGPFGTQLSKDEYVKEGVPIWGIPQINSKFQKAPTEYLTEEKANNLEPYSVLPYDIVMSRKGNVGKCAMYPKDWTKGILHSDALRIRLDKKKASPTFLVWQFRISRSLINQVNNVSSGAIMAGINVSKLKNIVPIVPPIKLQNQFAERIVLIEQQKALAKQELQESEDLFNCLLQKAFKGELV